MSKWTKLYEGQRFIDQVFMPAMRIVSGDCYWHKPTPSGSYDYVRTYAGRSWFNQQRTRHPFHPAVYDMMLKYRPDDWQQLLLEFPHKAITDPNRLAYTRDEKSAMHEGDSDIKAQVTTIGKYLRRHFSAARDEEIRDISAKYTYGGKTYVTQDPDEMVYAVINGPRSCMSPDFNILCDDGVRRHPYAVYDPDLGWAMVVRKDGEEILGRCLVLHTEDDDGAEIKGFVRSYKRERDQYSHSGTDEAIEVFLTSNGYTHWRRWPDGTVVRQHRTDSGVGFLMPYIDGGNQAVKPSRDGEHFAISAYGDWEASSTSGIIGGYEYTCEDCGCGFNDGYGTYTGQHDDHHVCSGCLDNYRYVYGRRGNRYYLHEDDDNVVYALDGDYYDGRYLGDNNMVTLHDGDVTDMDNAVLIDSQGEYYASDDAEVCYAEDTSQYELTDDCWQCEASGSWYTDDVESVEIDGGTYHPDNAPEQDEDEEKEAEAEPALMMVARDA